MSRERMVLLRDTVVHTFNFDKKRRNSGSSDLLLVSVLSFLLHKLESSESFAILFVVVQVSSGVFSNLAALLSLQVLNSLRYAFF